MAQRNIVLHHGALTDEEPLPMQPETPVKDLYDIGQIPPLGHVPDKMWAWSIRKERHGPPE